MPSLVLDADAALLPAAAELWKAEASSAGEAKEAKAEVPSALLLRPIVPDAVEASPSEDASGLPLEVLRLAFLFLPPLAPLLVLVLDEKAAAAFLAVAFFLEGNEDDEGVDVLAGMVGAASGAGASGTKLLFLATNGCEAAAAVWMAEAVVFGLG